MIFLGLITCGIYNIVISSKMVTEMNITTSRYDGRRTMPFLAMCTVAPLTLGIYTFIWMHGLCSRMGDELRRRNIAYSFGAADYWLWNLLGSLILVGPFIFLHKQMKALNLINGDFNRKG